MTEKRKVLNEKQSRAGLLKWAKRLGCEWDLLQIFDKYDKLLKQCTNELEKEYISLAGIEEIHNFFQFRTPLITKNNEIVEVVPEETVNQNNKFTKI